MSEDHYKKFVMIIRSAGFIVPWMIRSQNALNFAYILYLKLREEGLSQGQIGRLVTKWFVYSILTSRYGGSPERTYDFDIKQGAARPFKEYLASVEKAELSKAFWESGLIQRLNTSVASSPVFHVFLASMVKANDKGFLSRDITVADLINYRGDIHHIFPKNYLKKNNKARGEYNQIANYVMMQQEINIAISSKSPDKYFNEIKDQCNGGKKKYGAIETPDELAINLEAHCIPESIFNLKVDHYDDFLEQRRELIAKKIQKYYNSL